MNDWIFALSSGAGKSGIAVIRISGENLGTVFSAMIGADKTIKMRHAYLCDLTDNMGDLIDKSILIYFNAPHSFTGQDVIEIHCHGGMAVINKIFAHLATLGMRMAAPGEFSRLAFDNNKMDLTEIDGLKSLLAAKTERQRISALRSMSGWDAQTYSTWRSQMIEISAMSAAICDYPSDELPLNIWDTLQNRTMDLRTQIHHALNRYARLRCIQAGFNIVLAGDTNVGKSSLFNKILGTSRAIVSDIAGTTRDVISAQLDIDGYLVNLSDTAGLRESDDIIENIGIEKTHTEIKNADLILRVYAENYCDTPPQNNEIIVLNKSDLHSNKSDNFISVSAITGDGIDTLMHAIRDKIHEFSDGAESDISINVRTHSLLCIAETELNLAIGCDKNPDIFSEHTRAAADCLGKILGVISASDVMDATFSGLCLGK